EMISGSKKDVVVKIFGDDFAELKKSADKLVDVLRTVDGAKNVRIADQTSGQPTARVRIRPERLATYGVAARTVFDLVESLGGKQVGDILEGQLRFGLAVRLDDTYRSNPQALGDIPVETTSGAHVPLRRLADIGEIEGPGVIRRDSGRRIVSVEC